jgi:programmed cell death 8 (apoptosis-inducing factor)
VELDLRNSVAKLDNGWEISFEKCLIATGGQPKSLKIFKTATSRLKSKLTLYRGVSLYNIFFIMPFLFYLFSLHYS